MNIFLGGGRCSSRKNFAYSVRQSEYLSVKATGDLPVKNIGSTYYWNPSTSAMKIASGALLVLLR